MSTKPAIGAATISGWAGAVAQLLAAVAVYLTNGPTEVSLTALATGVLTLLKVLDGRYKQALAPPTTGTLLPRLQLSRIEGLGASIAPPYYHGSVPLPEDLADEEPGDADALPHLPMSDAPAVPDHDDSVHGR